MVKAGGPADREHRAPLRESPEPAGASLGAAVGDRGSRRAVTAPRASAGPRRGGREGGQEATYPVVLELGLGQPGPAEGRGELPRDGRLSPAGALRPAGPACPSRAHGGAGPGCAWVPRADV